MKYMASAVVLILTGVGIAVAAAFWMAPCSPRQAIVGVLLGCFVGEFAASRSPLQRDQESLLRRLRGLAGQFALIVGVGLLIYLAHERVMFPELPSWLDPVGEFVTGGMYLTLIAAPFTGGLFLLFHAGGRQQ